MALTDVMKLRAQAKKLGITGYKAMGAEELKKAIGNSNGKGTKTATKTAVKTAVSSAKGRKTASVKSAPAKSAKRQTTGAKRGPGRPPKSAVKSAPARRGRPPKAQSNGVSPNYHGGRNLIDDSEIDWSLEWNVSGIRGEIFKVVKKFKGDTDKSFDALADRATEFWKKNRAGDRILKERALQILRWNISRVKYDYVMATGQHKPSKKFGTLGTTQKLKGGKKSTRSTAKAQKPAQRPAGAKRRGRPPGSKNKSATKTARGRKTAGRK